MSFKIEGDYKIKLFGKEFNKVQHVFIVFGYVIFLMVIWPILSNSAFFMPLGIVLLPMFIASWVQSEIYKGKKLFRFLFYGGLVITTFLYTFFLLDCSFFCGMIHYAVYAVFGYLVQPN